MKNSIKIIEVGCAIIHQNGKLLIAQRKPDDHLGGYWEFPGGKVEPRETIEDCLIREVEEELGVRIKPEYLLKKAEHAYPECSLILHFYVCRFESGEPSKKDCHDFRWIHPEELPDFLFPPADADMIQDIIRNHDGYFLKT